MISSGINLVMTVIGFVVSCLFIVFVCTRLICARIHSSASGRAFSRAFGSSDHPSALERGLNGVDPIVVANFPTKKYKDLCLSSKEDAQCSVCLSEYRDEETLRILPACGHSFHAMCIDVWLQQHSTCPVCRISQRELPDRKWFMQPMFCSAVLSQPCPSISHNNSAMNCDPEPCCGSREGTRGTATDRSAMIKDLSNQKVESPSGR